MNYIFNPVGYDKPLMKWLSAIISIIMIGSFSIHLFWAIWDLQNANLNTFHYTELLINFQGGFVRRGLLGEIIFQFCKNTGVSPLIPIWILCFGCFMVVVCFFFFQFKKKNYNWWILLTPFMLGLTSDIIRKDYICYCIMIIMYYCYRSISIYNLKVIGITFFAIVGLFIHEAFIFFGIPLLFFLMIRNRITLTTLVCGSIIIYIFLLLSYYKGTLEIANAISNSWNQILGEGTLYDHPGSIGALSWTLGGTVKGHIFTNFYSSYLGWGTFFIRIIFFIIVYYFISNYFYIFKDKSIGLKDDLSINPIPMLFIFSIICLIPMFLFLSCDYGRLYQYAFISTILPFLLISRNEIYEAIGIRQILLIRNLNSKFRLSKNSNFYVIVLCLILLGESPYRFAPYYSFLVSPIGAFFTIYSYIHDGIVFSLH